MKLSWKMASGLAFIFMGASVLFFMHSCKKSSPANSAFIGKWYWQSNFRCISGTTIEISAGINDNSIVYVDTELDNCPTRIVLTGTVLGNEFVVPSTTFFDNCNKMYTISVTGTLVGDTLNITEIVTGALDYNCSSKFTNYP